MEDASIYILERIAAIIGSQSQKKLAHALEISEQAVSKGLKQINLPSTWVYKIAAKYGVRPEWLLTGEEPQQPLASETTCLANEKADYEARIAELERRVREKDDIIYTLTNTIKLMQNHQESGRES